MVGCCAPGCKRRTENGVRFFGFPIEPTRRKQWIIMTNRPHWIPTPHSKLCQFHFEDHMFKRKVPNWRLKPNAVPTLFLHNEAPIEDMLEPDALILAGIRTAERLESLDPPEPTPELAAHDHSYISLKKKTDSSGESSSRGLAPPVSNEVEIPSEITGRLIADFEDYQIIQTEPSSDLIFSESFTIDENSQITHHESLLSSLEDEQSESSEFPEGVIEEQEEEDGEEEHIELEEEFPKSIPVETGPTINIQSCDILCFRLRVALSSLKTSHAKVSAERDGLRNKLRKEKRRSKALEKQLLNQSVIPSFLQDDQLKYLQRGSHRGFAWSEETLKQANELKMACGTRGYIALLMHNFPLPGLSTLRSNKRKETEVTDENNDLGSELSLDTDDVQVQL